MVMCRKPSFARFKKIEANRGFSSMTYADFEKEAMDKFHLLSHRELEELAAQVDGGRVDRVLTALTKALRENGYRPKNPVFSAIRPNGSEVDMCVALD